MNPLIDGLPKDLSEMIGNSDWSPIEAPYSGASTYLLRSYTNVNSYLKVLSIPHTEPLFLANERLLWLTQKLPVPEVLYYGNDGSREFLLTREIEGVDCSDQSEWKDNVGEVIRLFAEGLRMVHQIDAAQCPFDHSLHTRLEIALHNMNSNLVDRQGIMKQFVGETVEQLYTYLSTEQTSISEDLVFTHGDYSMPNVIVHNGQISGFIDVGNCGVADKYQDLAIAAKSIIRNYGTEWVLPFFTTYGINEIDWNKIRYYQVLEWFVFP